MVNIGKEGRQTLQKLEFIWDFGDPERQLLSKLRDCTNLRKLHIGLYHSTTQNLRDFNKHKSKHQKKDLWEWCGQGEQTWELISQQPYGLELKIREGHFFYILQQPLTDIFGAPASTVVGKFEAELKEALRRLGKGKRRAAVEGWIKQRRARRV